ncbi:lipopolysaccharide assembly protein LapB [Halomonas sp. Bachu 37]|uniref:lipopolysaccharide assembly protein LapB n=1 Tax=Halomonas kashgarensis TaxID=3084920 RepID=UPI003216B310
MTDVVLLAVLLAAIAIGYGLGRWQSHRTRSTASPPSNTELSQEYFVGLNHLLNEQPDQAIETFVNVLEVNSETVDTHIALGKLFRSRGEADKAVGIHQNLLARPALAPHKNEQIQLELARDFMVLGLYDRAQRLLTQLLETSRDDSHRQTGKALLVDLLEREGEWQAAIDVTLGTLKRHPEMRRPTAHWFCELAEEDRRQASRAMAKRHLRKALQLDADCVRATLLLAELAMEDGHYTRAIEQLGHVPDQDSEHIPTLLPLLKRAYLLNDDEPGLRRHLEQLLARAPYTSTIVLLGETVHHQEGIDTAIEVVGEQLNRAPSLGGIDYLVDLYVESQQLAGRATDTRLLLLKRHTQALLDQRPRHRCRRCGFTIERLQWQCPSCRDWGTIKPITGIEGE